MQNTSISILPQAAPSISSVDRSHKEHDANHENYNPSGAALSERLQALSTIVRHLAPDFDAGTTVQSSQDDDENIELGRYRLDQSLSFNKDFSQYADSALLADDRAQNVHNL